MAIRNTDKLLVGRGDSSYYVTLENSGLGNDIPLSGTLSGKPITGDIDLDSGVFINIAGDGAGLNIKQNFWGALKYDGNLQLEWGKSGLKTGTDIMMKGGNTDYNSTTAEEQYSNTGSRAPWNEALHGHGIHWLKAPEHKYDAVNKEYVDNAVSSVGGGSSSVDLSGYATESYVEEALESINESGGSQGTGRKLGRWYMSYRSPANISSSDYGTIHRTNSDFHVSAKGYDPTGDGARPDVTEYFSSLSVGDTLYIRKDGDNEIEEVVLTKAEYDSSRNSFIFAPIPQTHDNANYYFYDGEGPLGNVPDPSGEYIKHMGPGRPASSSTTITNDIVWGLDSRGRKTGTSPANGAFFPFAWMKKNYPQMTGFSIAEGIGLSGVYDSNDSPKKIYDPTALTGGASVKAMTIDGVPGIGVWQGNQVYSNYSIRLFGIQVAFTY